MYTQMCTRVNNIWNNCISVISGRSQNEIIYAIPDRTRNEPLVRSGNPGFEWAGLSGTIYYYFLSNNIYFYISGETQNEWRNRKLVGPVLSVSGHPEKHRDDRPRHLLLRTHGLVSISTTFMRAQKHFQKARPFYTKKIVMELKRAQKFVWLCGKY